LEVVVAAHGCSTARQRRMGDAAGGGEAEHEQSCVCVGGGGGVVESMRRMHADEANDMYKRSVGQVEGRWWLVEWLGGSSDLKDSYSCTVGAACVGVGKGRRVNGQREPRCQLSVD
jgi:hypothetical protein